MSEPPVIVDVTVVAPLEQLSATKVFNARKEPVLTPLTCSLNVQPVAVTAAVSPVIEALQPMLSHQKTVAMTALPDVIAETVTGETALFASALAFWIFEICPNVGDAKPSASRPKARSFIGGIASGGNG